MFQIAWFQEGGSWTSAFHTSIDPQHRCSTKQFLQHVNPQQGFHNSRPTILKHCPFNICFFFSLTSAAGLRNRRPTLLGYCPINSPIVCQKDGVVSRLCDSIPVDIPTVPVVGTTPPPHGRGADSTSSDDGSQTTEGPSY